MPFSQVSSASLPDPPSLDAERGAERASGEHWTLGQVALVPPLSCTEDLTGQV